MKKGGKSEIRPGFSLIIEVKKKRNQGCSEKLSEFWLCCLQTGHGCLFLYQK
jgi:hypothetical protein